MPTGDHHLMRQYRRGDQRARAMLIERYIPLARHLALRYRRGSDQPDDLFQVACVGLVKAVDRWDPSRGFAFSSYAVPTIVGELRRYFRDTTWAVRPPRELQELALSVERARERASATAGRDPAVAELAERLGRSSAAVIEALHAAESRFAYSLDAPVYDDENEPAPLGERVGENDRGYEQAEARATVERLIPLLDRRAREVLHLRFYEGLLQWEIADRVGCSQMHISRILRAALEQLHVHAAATP
jgi:RNA polymerase sigma-B factor